MAAQALCVGYCSTGLPVVLQLHLATVAPACQWPRGYSHGAEPAPVRHHVLRQKSKSKSAQKAQAQAAVGALAYTRLTNQEGGR